MAHWLCSTCSTVNINSTVLCMNDKCKLNASSVGVTTLSKADIRIKTINMACTINNKKCIVGNNDNGIAMTTPSVTLVCKSASFEDNKNATSPKRKAECIAVNSPVGKKAAPKKYKQEIMPIDMKLVDDFIASLTDGILEDKKVEPSTDVNDNVLSGCYCENVKDVMLCMALSDDNFFF